MRRLLALFRRGRGRHRKPQTTSLTPPSVRLDASARGARVVRLAGRALPSRYAIEAEGVDMVRPYFRAFEERQRERAA
jgi:hypothetical protein